MILDYIEEKTPKGYILKIFKNKYNFLVFDKKGTSVYCESESMNVVHKIPVVVFLGAYFNIRRRMAGDYHLFKVSKNKIIIPYNIIGDKELKYLLLDTDENIDLVPVKIIIINSVLNLLKDVEEGLRPDLLIVDDNLTENEEIIIKSRLPHSKFGRVELKAAEKKILSRSPAQEKKEISEINLNMMSGNPVFLARVHLRSMQLSKVKQLLLDFDLTDTDASYISTFITNSLNELNDDEKKSNRSILTELIDDFDFYSAIMSNNRERALSIIDKADTNVKFSSLLTLIAKAESVIDPAKDKSINDSLKEFEKIIQEKKNS